METGDELSPFEIFEMVRKISEEDTILSEVIEKKKFEGSNMPYFESNGDEEIGDLIMQLKI